MSKYMCRVYVGQKATVFILNNWLSTALKQYQNKSQYLYNLLV